MTGPNDPSQYQPPPVQPEPYQSPGQPTPYQPQAYPPGQPAPYDPALYPPPDGAYAGQPTYPGAESGYPPPGGWPGVQEPPPRRRPAAWIWVLIAVVAVAAVVIAVAVVAGGDSKKTQDAADTAGRTLSLPSAVGGYQRIPVDPRQLVEQFRDQLAALGDPNLVNKALVGVYGKGSSAQLVFFGLAVKDVPKLQDQIDNDGVEAAVKQFAGGISSGVQGAGGKVTSPIRSVDPGKLGGTMQCGQVEVLTRAAGVCAWGDRSAFSFNLLLNPTDTATTAEIVRQLRAAAEH
jgi:hypothetical protein